MTTTGFAPVPWDLFTANDGELEGLPPAEPRHEESSCPSEWNGPTDSPGEEPWYCCLPLDHTGTHRASNGTETLAEWA